MFPIPSLRRSDVLLNLQYTQFHSSRKLLFTNLNMYDPLVYKQDVYVFKTRIFIHTGFRPAFMGLVDDILRKLDMILLRIFGDVSFYEWICESPSCCFKIILFDVN